MRTLFASTVPILGALPCFAQTVWNVPQTPLAIQAAIAAASPGDVLVLTDGPGLPDHGGFTLDKGLTIRGNGASIGSYMGAPWQGATNEIVVNVPPGQVAHLENLRCTYSYSPVGSLGTKVVVQGGTVRFEGCTIANGPGVVSVTNANLTLVSCHVTGYSLLATPAIAATNANVTLTNCFVTGANAGCHPSGCGVATWAAQPGIALVGSTLRVDYSTINGGNQAFTSVPGTGAPALVVAGASRVWLMASNLIGGSSQVAPGGTALVNNGPIAVETRQTGLQGGVPNGAPSSGPLDPTAPLLWLTQAPVWTRGVTSTLTFSGNANAVYGLALAPDTAPAALPLVVEPVWAVTGVFLAMGTLDGLGVATYPVAVPNVAALEHMGVWCQGVSGLQLPLRASTIVGGVVR
jgi:hypothetical protein